MIHHDSRDYAEAKSQAAAVGRKKMEEIIETGRAKAGQVVEGVLSRVIDDRIVRAKGVMVRPTEDGFRMWTPDCEVGAEPKTLPRLHQHAMDQILSDVGMPKLFANKLEKEANGTRWGAELVAHTVNTILGHRENQKNLVRSESQRVMGWLSDKFRRLDSRPLLDSFIGASNDYGLVPVDGVASDTKCRIRAILPRVFEPVKDEVMLFGLEWGNSDYGDGGHVVNIFTTRLYCTNIAVCDQALRQIHLGKRLSDDIRYSEETYKADTEANVLALKDIVKYAIGPDRVNAMCDVIKNAAEDELKGKDVAAILKSKLDKADIEKALAAYESHDVQNLPPGNTRWRLSNAISWIAQGKDVSPDKKMELQSVAGELIKPKKGEVVEV